MNPIFLYGIYDMKKNVSISKPKSNPNHLVSKYTSLRADVGHDINGFGFSPNL